MEQDQVHFGVEGSRSRAFGDSLMWALERQFRSNLTPELRDAWTMLYDLIGREAGSRRRTRE
jgi:hypothetical protein